MDDSSVVPFESRPNEACGLIPVGSRILLLQVASNSIQVLCRLLRRNAGFQPSDHCHGGVEAALKKVPAFHLFFIDHWNEIIRPEEPLHTVEVGSCHADNGERMSAEIDRLANHCRICVEFTPPQSI